MDEKWDELLKGVSPGTEAEQRADTMPDRPRNEGRNKGGRPRGFDGTRSKMPSALAQAFKRAGLDWRTDFALAIKGNKKERIGMWMKLLPYLVTTTSRARMVAARKWKGKPSKAAMKALMMLEDVKEIPI